MIENPYILGGLSVALYVLVVISYGMYKRNKRDWGENYE